MNSWSWLREDEAGDPKTQIHIHFNAHTVHKESTLLLYLYNWSNLSILTPLGVIQYILDGRWRLPSLQGRVTEAP